MQAEGVTKPQTIRKRKRRNTRPKNKKLKLTRLLLQDKLPRKLFVFDLNGVLISRTKSRDLILNPCIKEKSGLLGYIRPNVTHLLKWLKESKQAVALWSSGSEYTCSIYSKLLFPKRTTDGFNFVYDGSYCIKRHSLHKGKPLMVKDLKIVWEQFTEWNEHNTVLIEDTKEKCENSLPNTLLLPTFKPEMSKSEDIFHEDSSIWDYLKRLILYKGDVKEFLATESIVASLQN